MASLVTLGSDQQTKRHWQKHTPMSQQLIWGITAWGQTLCQGHECDIYTIPVSSGFCYGHYSGFCSKKTGTFGSPGSCLVWQIFFFFTVWGSILQSQNHIPPIAQIQKTPYSLYIFHGWEKVSGVILRLSHRP